MKTSRAVLGALLACVAVVAVVMEAAAAEWQIYESKDYGIVMLMPEGTELVESEWTGGWASLEAEFEGVSLVALAKLGKPVEAEAIEAEGVRLTKIPADEWTVVDEGAGVRGWTWYKTVLARDETSVVYGGYGVGPKGSYLLVLTTTPEDYEAHKPDYRAWYASILLR